ncbi:two-component sensor histidine kinase [Paenibacillus sp. 598K]|uniref:sensor histidine kinase n=1 Tax=Paenibacillus sp. 598K TaxID=1117987 RepID=UPI000FF9DAB7|nr:histidine kinase [Paenibacillus sp. 598K]GBF77703.1 two-component sensor histidine kinase [Paenibacillus sp. 598K]
MSLLARLIITFVAVLMPLYVLTLVINDKGAQSIRKEISQSINGRNTFYLSMLENEIERVKRMLPEYVADNDLQALSTTGHKISDYEKVALIKAIQKRMSLIKYNSMYINEVRVYVPLLDRTLLSSSFDTRIDREEMEALKAGSYAQESPLIYWQDRMFIGMQFPPIADREPLFVVAVEISVQKLMQALGEQVSISHGKALLVNLNRNWSVSSESAQAIMPVLRAYLAEHADEGVVDGNTTLTVDGAPHLVYYKYSEQLDTYLVSYVPESYITDPIRKYQYWIMTVSVLSGFIILFFSLSIYRMIHQPMKRLIMGFKRMRAGEIEPIPHPPRQGEFGYLYQAYNETALHLKLLIQENYEQKIYSQRSELKRLQSQINPHFLYNCFFVLCRLIKSEDLELSYRFCRYLGDYFQFITRDDSDQVPLEVEIKHARTYVELQKVCYGERIQIRFDLLDAAYAKQLVPRLILQPIVENVYKHAATAMVHGGELAIRFDYSGQDLAIVVEDSGTSLMDAQLLQLNRRLAASGQGIEDTTGMINVHRRIQIMYGPQYGLFLSRSELGGLKVMVRLALDTGGED